MHLSESLNPIQPSLFNGTSHLHVIDSAVNSDPLLVSLTLVLAIAAYQYGGLMIKVPLLKAA